MVEPPAKRRKCNRNLTWRSKEVHPGLEIFDFDGFPPREDHPGIRLFGGPCGWAIVEFGTNLYAWKKDAEAQYLQKCRDSTWVRVFGDTLCVWESDEQSAVYVLDPETDLWVFSPDLLKMSFWRICEMKQSYVTYRWRTTRSIEVILRIEPNLVFPVLDRRGVLISAGTSHCMYSKNNENVVSSVQIAREGSGTIETINFDPAMSKVIRKHSDPESGLTLVEDPTETNVILYGFKGRSRLIRICIPRQRARELAVYDQFAVAVGVAARRHFAS